MLHCSVVRRTRNMANIHYSNDRSIINYTPPRQYWAIRAPNVVMNMYFRK